MNHNDEDFRKTVDTISTNQANRIKIKNSPDCLTIPVTLSFRKISSIRRYLHVGFPS